MGLLGFCADTWRVTSKHAAITPILTKSSFMRLTPMNSVISATSAASGSARIVQNLKDLLRPHPAFHIDLPAGNPLRRFQQGFMLVPAGAELTVPMRWSLDSDHGRSQMCDVTKKLHRAFAIPIFHLSIRRTHPA